jgi:hypothetical protein
LDSETELLDVTAAAVRLGITPDAVRKHIRRRQLAAIKDADGQWRVRVGDLDSVPDQSRDRAKLPSDQARDRSRDSGPVQDGTSPAPQDGAAAVWERLVSAKDDELARLAQQYQAEVARLVEQLAVKDEQLRQANVIIAQLSRRPPELQAPAGTTVPPAANGATHDVTTAEAATATPAPSAQVRRPWWAFWRPGGP